MRYDLNKEKDCKALSRRIFAAYQKFSKGLGRGEDCVQEILCRMLEGRHQHSTIDQAVIDYLRSTYGDSRVFGDIERQNHNFPDPLEPGDFDRILPMDFRRKSSNRLDFDECAKRIGNQIDRGIFGLFFKWGLNEAEIGNLFGFSPSRVCQRLKRIQSSISARIKSEESRDKKESQAKVAGLLSEKAKGNLRGMEQVSFERMEVGQSWGMESFNEQSLSEWTS